MVQTTENLRPLASTDAATERRREILAAASRLFRSRGLQRVGMRDIARELSCTAGNLYYYFPSKTDLLAYCQEATIDDLLDGAEEIAAGGGTVAERLRRIVRAHAISLNETYPGSLAHLEVEALEATERPRLLAKRRRYQALIESLIADGVQRGELAVVSPRLAALALLGAMNWTVKWYSPAGDKSAGEVGDAFASLLLDGLRRRDR